MDPESSVILIRETAKAGRALQVSDIDIFSPECVESSWKLPTTSDQVSNT
jgi:hypothetical protein